MQRASVEYITAHRGGGGGSSLVEIYRACCPLRLEAVTVNPWPYDVYAVFAHCLDGSLLIMLLSMTHTAPCFPVLVRSAVHRETSSRSADQCRRCCLLSVFQLNCKYDSLIDVCDHRDHAISPNATRMSHEVLVQYWPQSPHPCARACQNLTGRKFTGRYSGNMLHTYVTHPLSVRL